jgi:hypothetical protein
MRHATAMMTLAAALLVSGCAREEVAEPQAWPLRFDDTVQGECSAASSPQECAWAECLFMDASVNGRGSFDVLLENRCEDDLFMFFQRDEVELQRRDGEEHPGVAGFGRMYMGGEELFVFGGWFWREEGARPGASPVVEVRLRAGERTFMFDAPTVCSAETSTCQSFAQDREGSAADVRARIDRNERVDVVIELPIPVPASELPEARRYDGCSDACGLAQCADKAGFMTFTRPAAYSPNELSLSRCGSRASVGE